MIENHLNKFFPKANAWSAAPSAAWSAAALVIASLTIPPIPATITALLQHSYKYALKNFIPTLEHNLPLL